MTTGFGPFLSQRCCPDSPVRTGVAFNEAGKLIKVFFPNPKAALKVRQQAGKTEWVPWGRRKEEEGKLPNGGWARVDSVQAGKWKRFHPQLVIIAATQYMEKDAERTSHWFNVEEGMGIQGLIAQLDEERRIYVVTVETPAEFAYIHDRCPNVVSF